MSTYAGRHAELYDLIYAEKPYGEEAAFIHKCLQRFSIGSTKRLLELACGTCTHALELEALGYEIVAVDNSEDMLTVARRKATEGSSRIRFLRQDLRSLDVPGGAFDVATCLFDSIGYVETNRALLNVLGGVNKHLRPNGIFVFEFWHAAAMLRTYDPVRVRRWVTESGDLIRISRTSLDVVSQVAEVAYTIIELRSDGSFSELREIHRNRYFQVQEMAALLDQAGLEPVKWYNGFSDDERVTEDTWHVLAVARKVNGPKRSD